MVIPILEPDSKSYRPISLISVLGKLLERILNKRLICYLESNRILIDSQYGFKKNRSTIQAIFDLQSQIQSAFSSKSRLFTIFFDLEKAYDRVWRYGICQLMRRYGLKRHLPAFLQNFLQDRSLVVRIGGAISQARIVQNGVPQGSVLRDSY